MTKKVKELEETLKRSRGRQTDDFLDLSDGDDLATLNISYSISAEADNYRRSEVVAYYSGAMEITWNDLFRAVAPRIAPVANDASIRTGINTLLKGRFKPKAKEAKKNEWVSSVTIAEDSYNVVKVQFTALGLVTIGKERDADGSLSGILWRITEMGEARMLRSLAIRRGPEGSV